uniref:Uncharacterized protein n=1 Tax=Physcomitrium patens TaxID=3218 RepID=A0A2K1JP49_PHYPA|nr:hypothetical protein PHYPA_015698 [Physcomitrium patens]
MHPGIDQVYSPIIVSIHKDTSKKHPRFISLSKIVLPRKVATFKARLWYRYFKESEHYLFICITRISFT